MITIQSLYFLQISLCLFLLTHAVVAQCEHVFTMDEVLGVKAILPDREPFPENIGNRIKLADVIHYVGYSQSHFSQLFRHQKGVSPLAYFNQMKVEYACKMLRETDMKINQICYKIGIEDPFYFSRMFSKIVGMSPSEYRTNVTSC